MCLKLIILLLFAGFSVIFATQILVGHRGPENIDRRGIMETHISLHDNGTLTGKTSLKSKKRNGFTGI
uniref:Uncharacterized protein n=1 Tax=Panagrolaimus davidi TaxID=227884 RepID=A0A914PL65_9BILA